MTADIDISKIISYREEAVKKIGPSILKMPIIKNLVKEINNYINENVNLLDIGAGVKKPLSTFINKPGQKYTSLDIDPEGEFDYKYFSEIPTDKYFNLIIANQVFEHVTHEIAIEILKSAYNHLESGGHFIATVPSMFHPVRYWGDFSHISIWPIFDFYGLFRHTGYEVINIKRYNKFRFTRNPIKSWIIKVICESFRVDWCDSIMIIARKSENAD